MSKLIGPDHNGESGQIAGKVFYRQFGQQLARKVPTPTTKPPVKSQLDQRYGRFAPAFAFSKQMKYIAKELFEVQPSSRTAFSTMTKQVFPAFQGTQEAHTCDLTKAYLGNGSLPAIPLLSCSETVPGTVNIGWSPATSTPNETGNDTVTVMISDDDGTRSSFVVTTVKRSIGTASFARPAWSMPSPCHVSGIFFRGVDGIFRSTFRAADPTGDLAADD